MTEHSLIALENQSFDELSDAFGWPEMHRLNIAEVVCERFADGSNRLALIAENEAGDCERYSFDDINRLANRLASAFQLAGIEPGDRVAVILPQRVETALVHIAAQKLGAISLPLSVLFGDDALEYRLADSGSKIVIAAVDKLDLIDELSGNLPELQAVWAVSESAPVPATTVDRQDRAAPSETHASSRIEAADFWGVLRATDDAQFSCSSSPDDPAFLLYTSGTTGPPKGALIPQRALIGNLTGFECSQNGFPQEQDVMFTPADWAWTGGLLDGLLPAWYYGAPVVALDYKKFRADIILSLMSRHKVTCAFIPPTALKMLRSEPALLERYPLALRAVMSAGEAVGEELYRWGQKALGLDINEMCGQTEHNYLIGNCSALMPVRPGSMGKAYPGHKVAIMGPDGTLLPDGQEGEIVAHKDDPVHFLGYWKNPEATASKYTGDWFHLGDIGYRDAEGYLWFVGRADDVISSAGYRIGPGEIEDCVLKHPAVQQVAAIGVPDPDGIRGDVVKLCIVLNPEIEPSSTLEKEIQTQVRTQLAAYEYPRQIEFMEALPMTTTGKIKRMELRRMHIERLSS
ncbi:MAG: AMP-binding protein [Gammaproteobacteria bacterium]|nr:AMP-binding protein [Gammaproteobacteria bacterium]